MAAKIEKDERELYYSSGANKCNKYDNYSKMRDATVGNNKIAAIPQIPHLKHEWKVALAEFTATTKVVGVGKAAMPVRAPGVDSVAAMDRRVEIVDIIDLLICDSPLRILRIEYFEHWHIKLKLVKRGSYFFSCADCPLGLLTPEKLQASCDSNQQCEFATDETLLELLKIKNEHLNHRSGETISSEAGNHLHQVPLNIWITHLLNMVHYLILASLKQKELTMPVLDDWGKASTALKSIKCSDYPVLSSLYKRGFLWLNAINPERVKDESVGAQNLLTERELLAKYHKLLRDNPLATIIDCENQQWIAAEDLRSAGYKGMIAPELFELFNSPSSSPPQSLPLQSTEPTNLTDEAKSTVASNDDCNRVRGLWVEFPLNRGKLDLILYNEKGKMISSCEFTRMEEATEKYVCDYLMRCYTNQVLGSIDPYLQQEANKLLDKLELIGSRYDWQKLGMCANIENYRGKAVISQDGKIIYSYGPGVEAIENVDNVENVDVSDVSCVIDAPQVNFESLVDVPLLNVVTQDNEMVHEWLSWMFTLPNDLEKCWPLPSSLYFTSSADGIGGVVNGIDCTCSQKHILEQLKDAATGEIADGTGTKIKYFNEDGTEVIVAATATTAVAKWSANPVQRIKNLALHQVLHSHISRRNSMQLTMCQTTSVPSALINLAMGYTVEIHNPLAKILRVKSQPQFVPVY